MGGRRLVVKRRAQWPVLPKGRFLVLMAQKGHTVLRPEPLKTFSIVFVTWQRQPPRKQLCALNRLLVAIRLVLIRPPRVVNLV